MRRLWWMVPVVLLAAALGCGRKTPPAPPKAATIAWLKDAKAAFEESKRTGKPVMMDLWQIGCANCEHLDQKVWARTDVADLSKQFVPVKLNGQEHPDLGAKYSVSGYPTTLFLRADGKLLSRMRGEPFPEDMIAAMQDVLKKAPAPKK